MLQILNVPNPILSQKSAAIKKIDKNLLGFINGMKQALEKARNPVGVGLAAPQVGENIRVFLAKPTLKSKIFVFINPRIVEESDENKIAKTKVSGTKKLEGCLSLKDIWGEVKRKSSVTVQFTDENGKKFTKKFSGFMATIIHHEIYHL